VRAAGRSRKDSLASGVLRVHLMLVAFGVENLFKAQLVKTRRSALMKQFDDQEQLPTELRTHDLIRLARLVGFDATDDDEALFRRLTRAAIWSGRYPIPVHISARSRTELCSDGVVRSVAYGLPRDIDDLKVLVSRIRESFGLHAD